MNLQISLRTKMKSYTIFLYTRQIRRVLCYAVISVGKDNSYGHPADEVLSRLRDAEVTTFRTDMQGDISCVSDGKTVEFTVSRNQDADIFASVDSNSTQKTAENKSGYSGLRKETITNAYSPCRNSSHICSFFKRLIVAFRSKECA